MYLKIYSLDYLQTFSLGKQIYSNREIITSEKYTTFVLYLLYPLNNE